MGRIVSREELLADIAAAKADRMKALAEAKAAAPAGKAPFDSARILSLRGVRNPVTDAPARDVAELLHSLEYDYYVSYPGARTMEELAEALERYDMG